MSGVEKEGMLFKAIYLPKRLKIEAEQLDDKNWRLHYIETFPEMPKEAFEFSMKAAKNLGITMKKRKNTAYYTVIGTRDAIFGAILAEALGMSKIGDITLREIFALVTLGFAGALPKPKLKKPEEKGEG